MVLLLVLSLTKSIGESLQRAHRIAQPNGVVATFSVSDLGTLGGDFSAANAINDHGLVVGDSKTKYESSHGFIYVDGTIHDLGTDGTIGSSAQGVNNAGSIVGWINPKGGGFTGHYWAVLYRNGRFLRLLGRRSDPDCAAVSINNHGVMVGASGSAQAIRFRAVQWDADGQKVVDLGALRGSRSTQATSISDDGRVVGISGDHAVLFHQGEVRDLGTLGGKLSYASHISSNGNYIVGHSLTQGGQEHACLWRNNQIADLGTLGGPEDDSNANGVNDSGQIVGTSRASIDNAHAFLWQHGKMYNLNNLIPQNSGWILRIATSINNRGEIVGIGKFHGHSRAFLLSHAK